MSNRIADFRKIRRMSPGDLSEACGLSKSTLSELERGITQPMLDSARRIANALDAYEHEIWPEDATMGQYQKKCPIDGGNCGEGGTCYVCENEALDAELATAKARIADLEKALEPLADMDFAWSAEADARLIAAAPAMRAALEAALRVICDPESPITDTLWASGHETLADAIASALPYEIDLSNQGGCQ